MVHTSSTVGAVPGESAGPLWKRAETRLLAQEQRAKMLVALLGVGVVLSTIAIVISAREGMRLTVLVETALVTVKLGCILWLLRRQTVSGTVASALVALNTACATAGNFLYPGTFRPFTGQLLLAVLFVTWLLPMRHVPGHLVLLATAAAVTVIGVPPVDELLRVATVLLTGATIAAVSLALRARQAQLTAQATLDPLTGIGNRRAYDERLASALAHAERHREALSLVLIDLDGFKQLNDTQGHPAGDAELRSVARLLASRARLQDSVFRLGGDEFAVLLPGTGSEGAVTFAEDLSSHAGRRRIGLRTSLTAGVASFPEHADAPHGLERAADIALLDGKRAGKGRVLVSRGGDGRVPEAGGDSGASADEDAAERRAARGRAL